MQRIPMDGGAVAGEKGRGDRAGMTITDMKGMRHQGRARGIALLVTTAALSSVEVSAQGSEDGFTLPTIMVSPEWRPVDAQRVARSVDHHDGRQLDRAGVYNTIDLQYRVPGFVFKTNSVLGQPYLRGVGSDFISAGAESSVATFIDGVYMPRAFDTIVDFFDVESVEVLKGPQGVHLGRNVVGGAVSVRTRDPEPYPSAYADVQLGSYDERRLRGAVNVPLGGPGLVLRLAGATAKRDGYVDNIFLGTDIDDEDYHAVRGKLLYAPSSRLSLLFSAEYRSEDSTRALGSQPDPTIGRNGGIEMGGTVPADPRQITENTEPFIDVEAQRYSLRLDWQGDDLRLLSTTAWLRTEAALALDLDGTDADYASNHPGGRSETLTQELRFSSPEDRRGAWVAGLFFLDERAFQTLDTRLPQTETRNVPAGDVDTLSYAAFAQYAWRIDAAWRVKAGLRYSRDERTLDLVRTVSNPSGVTVTTQNERRHWQAWTPEIAIEYAARSDRFWYATVSRGYKAGGFNTSTIQDAFDPEFLWAYEAGVKTDWPAQSLRANAALFYYDYRDMQLNTPPGDAPPGTFPRVINAAEATLYGLDMEMLWHPRRDLELSLRGMLLDSRFDDFVSLDPNNPGVDPDRSGGRLPQAPSASVNVAAYYLHPLTHGMLRIGGEYRYQSSIYFNIYEDPALKQDGYGLFNASVGFESHDQRWYAELYGRNLTDELYAQTILRNDPLTGTKRFWGPPRTAGIRVGYRWW